MSFMFTDENKLDPDIADLSIQQGADLFFLATELKIEPIIAVEVRVKNNGILAMAEYLILTAGKKAVIYGPMLREQIGSYSYEKMMNITQGTATGVLWFDAAVKYFQSKDPLSSTTSVFEKDDHMLWKDSDGNLYVLGPGERHKRHHRPRPDSPSPFGWM